MFWVGRPIVVIFFLIGLANSLNCYDCPIGIPSCTTICSGATSCAIQVTFPVSYSSQLLLRCERNITSQGCIGDLATQTLTYYCITDLCNLNLNTVLSSATTSPKTAAALPVTPPIGNMAFPAATTLMPMGRRKRESNDASKKFEFPSLTSKVGEKKPDLKAGSGSG